MGITTGCGNTNAAQAAENTLRVIKMANPGYEVPVAVGENKPLVGEWEGPVPHIHGFNGVGDVELPASDQKLLDEHASDFIVRMGRHGVRPRQCDPRVRGKHQRRPGGFGSGVYGRL